ncbi:MAG: GNAT family N-acetyltransferase [Asgard group archaeon]|nr:GNAT family N-acetyltransferase [Asgard group archaeon]
MTYTITSGPAEKMFPQVSAIVLECFEGVWTADDLQQLINIPHDSKIFFVAKDESDNIIAYIFLATDYIEDINAKITTVQELGVLPDFRTEELLEDLIQNSIDYATQQKAVLIEQFVSTIDHWLIPYLLHFGFQATEIKADKEIIEKNEAKIMLQKLEQTPQLEILMNQLFFEKDEELEAIMIESDEDINTIDKNQPLAFGSIINVKHPDELEQTLRELTNCGIEWDEISITFNYQLRGE